MNNKKSFTLIELLVVIFIIALLATIITVSVSKIRKKSRDVKRISDFKTLSTALEIYNNEHGSYIDIPSTGQCSTADFQTVLAPLVTDGIIDKIPIDPGKKIYQYCSDQHSGSQEYTLLVQLETNHSALQSDFDGMFYTSWSGDDFDCADGTSNTYCVVSCNDTVNENPNSAWPNCGTY